MSNFIDLPNITPESIVFGNGGENTPKKQGNFSLKNYLDTSLGEGETEKTITIRLLPMDINTGNPFVRIHVHNIQVPKELVKPNQRPFRDFICVRKTADIDHERYGYKCPLCEVNNSAYEEAKKYANDPVMKKSWTDVSCAHKAKEAVILRCIERGKENEGVKFWKFKLRDDKTDPYNQILRLYQKRKEEGEKAGVEINILDIYNGRDLEITITEGTAAPKVLDCSISTPLSKDEELMKKWIYDPKKWQEVFTCKDYEYLALVDQMKIPYYDKDKGVWVDRDIYDKEHGIVRGNQKKEEADKANEEINKAEQAAKAETPAPAQPAPVQQEQAQAQPKQSFAASITVQDEDLPF